MSSALAGFVNSPYPTTSSSRVDWVSIETSLQLGLEGKVRTRINHGEKSEEPPRPPDYAQ